MLVTRFGTEVLKFVVTNKVSFIFFIYFRKIYVPGLVKCSDLDFLSSTSSVKMKPFVWYYATVSLPGKQRGPRKTNGSIDSINAKHFLAVYYWNFWGDCLGHEEYLWEGEVDAFASIYVIASIMKHLLYRQKYGAVACFGPGEIARNLFVQVH